MMLPLLRGGCRLLETGRSRVGTGGLRVRRLAGRAPGEGDLGEKGLVERRLGCRIGQGVVEGSGGSREVRRRVCGKEAEVVPAASGDGRSGFSG
jgi:hypothetical protein